MLLCIVLHCCCLCFVVLRLCLGVGLAVFAAVVCLLLFVVLLCVCALLRCVHALGVGVAVFDVCLVVCVWCVVMFCVFVASPPL